MEDCFLIGQPCSQVYIRPVESYGSHNLELRRVAAHPKWAQGEDDESLVLVGNYETADVLRSAESALLEIGVGKFII